MALVSSGWHQQTGTVTYIAKANWPGSPYNGLPYLILQNFGGWPCGDFQSAARYVSPYQVNSATIVIVFSADLSSIKNAVINAQGSTPGISWNTVNYQAYFNGRRAQ